MKNLYKIMGIFIISLMVNANAQTNKSVLELPEISVIGDFLATSTDSESNSFDVNEIEFMFQHYLAPSVRATVVTALEKEEDSGEFGIELEEAYVVFSDFADTLFPSTETIDGVGVTLGKKLLNIGRLNALHNEQLPFVDKPIAHQQFFGADHGLHTEGGQVTYLLPFSFFSQVELGYGTVTAEDEEEEEDHSEIEYENRIFTGRLWNGVELSSSQDLELGFSYLLGNASESSTEDQQLVVGFDVMYHQALSKDRNFQIHAEYYDTQYAEDGEDRETQTGGFISGYLDINSMYDAGIRYGILGQHGDEGDEMTQWSFIVSRQLSETSKFRIQYNTGDNVEDTVYAQFIFGMGPHSHVLQ